MTQESRGRLEEYEPFVQSVTNNNDLTYLDLQAKMSDMDIMQQSVGSTNKEYRIMSINVVSGGKNKDVKSVLTQSSLGRCTYVCICALKIL